MKPNALMLVAIGAELAVLGCTGTVAFGLVYQSCLDWSSSEAMPVSSSVRDEPVADQHADPKRADGYDSVGAV